MKPPPETPGSGQGHFDFIEVAALLLILLGLGLVIQLQQERPVEAGTVSSAQVLVRLFAEFDVA